MNTLLAETINIDSGTIVLLGFLLTVLGVLIGGAVAWGALRNTVTRLEATVTRLEATVQQLTRDVAVLADRGTRSEHDREPTGNHSAVQLQARK